MIFHILFNYNQSNQIMDEKIQKILEEKIHEATERDEELSILVNSFKEAGTDEVNAFGHGIVIGRLYNSFYYQSRRILKRNPSEQEFSEFVQLLTEHKNELELIFG